MREIQPPHNEDASPLKGKELKSLHKKLGNGWRVIEEHHLEKEYSLPNFQEALEYTNRVGVLAEAANHHPEICLTWGKVKITIWTHNIGGLSEADFVFAAKADQLLN